MGFSGQICTDPGKYDIITETYTFFYLEYIECDVNPCENNGTCRLLAGSYLCNCSQGFSGLFCEQSILNLIRLVFSFAHLQMSHLDLRKPNILLLKIVAVWSYVFYKVEKAS